MLVSVRAYPAGIYNCQEKKAARHNCKLKVLASSNIDEAWYWKAWADGIHALIAVSKLDGLIYARRGS